MTDTRPQPTPFQAPSQAEPQTPPAVSPDAAREEKHLLLAGCAYLGVLFLIPLLLLEEPKDEFVRFHLRQGIALFALGTLASFGFHVPGGSMLMLVVVVISLVGALRAWRGDRWTLPVIGRYAAKIAL